MRTTSRFILFIIISLFAFSPVFAQDTPTLAQETARSQSLELTIAAMNNLNTDAELSALLALQAVNTTYAADGTVLPEANTVLHQAVQGLRSPMRLEAARLPWDGFVPVAFSLDGTRVFYPLNIVDPIGRGTLTAVADATTGRVLYTVDGMLVPDHVDDNRILTIFITSDDGVELQSWDISSPEQAVLLQTLPISASIEADDIDSAANMTYYVQWDRFGATQVWDLASGEEITADSLRIAGRTHPAFSPDGTRLALRNSDGTATILDTSTWTPILTLSADGAHINTHYMVFNFSGDSRFVAASNSNDGVSLWDLSTGEEQQFSPPFSPDLVALNADGSRLSASTDAGELIVWDTTTHEELANFGVSSLFWLNLSPDGTRLATLQSGLVQIWNIASGAEVLTMTNSDPDPDLGPLGIAYSPDGTRVVAASVTETPIVWDATTGQQIFTLTGHTDRVQTVAWSADGAHIASAGLDTDVILWNAATGEQERTLSGHEDSLYAVAFNPDGTRLASSSADQTVRVWDVATGDLQLTLDQPASSKGVAWSPDGTRIVAGTNNLNGNGHFIIWNASTGEQQLDIPVGNTRTGTVAFSPDGTRIVGGTLEGQAAHVWDAQTGELLLNLDHHTNIVSGVAYSSDGTQIATGSHDGTIRLWDAATGAELLTLNGAPEGIARVAFSPDGAHLATQNEDGTTRVFDVSIDGVIALTESRLTRSLTDAECQRYLHTDTCPA